MKLRQLRAVVAVARHGSMSAAAEAIGLSQPAVTRVVTLLEEDHGVRLFRRSGAGATPTAEGASLAAAGERAFAHLAAMAPGDHAFLRGVADHELAALIALDGAGSVRRAAEDLGVTPTAVARSLSTLEARLGRALFASGASARRLLPWAAEAAIEARRALNVIASAERALRESGQGATVLRLRIGALPASRVALVPEAVRRFAASAAAVEISIVDDNYEALLSRLYAGEIDLIVGSLRARNAPAWLATEPLFDDHLVVVSAQDHPLQRLPSIDWWDLRAARWVLPGAPTPIRAEFDRMLGDHAIPRPAQIVEVDSFIAARALILTGDWLGIFSASQILAEEQAGLLRRIAAPRSGPARKVGAMTRREEPSRALAAFLGHLRIAGRDIAAALAAGSAPKLIGRDLN